MKRILDCQASDFRSMDRTALLTAIAGAEGRTVACETIGSIMPMLGDITNAEFAASMGADILLLNMFDVQQPVIRGLPKCPPEDTVRKLKELTGRPIGINLEPVEQVLSSLDPEENMWAMTPGRKATLANARIAADMGVNFILLTGNPGVGVSNAAIEQTLRLYKQELGDRLILPRAKCTPPASLARVRRGSSPRKIFPPLPKPARTSYCCPLPERFPVFPWNASGSWWATPTVWVA